ncbi:MAG TPA: PEP-CTERM sorting domain-containing protein [Tepidisphaeraceae bacterium]|nr:PEP-CTERM sorting domain-containing protein [Tepidisphaeraceae bacterium]
MYYNDVNGDASLTMYLATDASDRSQANVFITPGSGYLDIPFSNFTNVGTSPANFQHIGSIYFDLQVGYPAGNPIDFQMGDISITNTAAPVPEPSSFALLGLGGLFLLRRRLNIA